MCLLIISLLLNFSAFAYESLDVIQKDCQTSQLSETTSSHYYMGSVVFKCDNDTSVKFDYQDKLVRGYVFRGKLTEVIATETELNLIHDQMKLFYQESNEYKIKKQYEYKLPVRDTPVTSWY